MKNTATMARFLALTTFLALGLISAPATAQEKPWTEGTVWSVSFIRVKPGMSDVYLREVLPMRKKIDEEAKKQGLLVSSHVFAGIANGRDDFDIMFMDEFKNWAAFDGMTAKYDAIMQRVIGSEEKQVQVMQKRTDVREILGDKVMQELIIK